MSPSNSHGAVAPIIPLARPDRVNPVAATKLLGAHLRSLRQDARLGIKDVAPVIRASVSKISRLERGESAASERDVRDLLDFYGVTDEELWRAVEDLLRQIRVPAWWQQYSDVTPGWLRRLISLEDSASHIRTYEMMVVPGLLQTPAYTRALVKSGFPYASEAEVQRRLDLRQKRQEVLRGEGAPMLRALLDESVLRRPRGGAQVMVEQLQYLKQIGQRRNIAIRVVRYVRAAHIAPPTPITYMKFAAGGGLPEIVYLEQAGNATYLSQQDDVNRHRHILDELQRAAESRTATLAMLNDLIREFSAG